jgi:Flp pilus assembly protein TadB
MGRSVAELLTSLGQWIASLTPRTRYLAFTFAFIALIVALMLLGQFMAMALVLIVMMIYAPRIVAIVEGHKSRRSRRMDATDRQSFHGPWG